MSADFWISTVVLVCGCVVLFAANRLLDQVRREAKENRDKLLKDAQVFNEFAELWNYGAHVEARDLMSDFVERNKEQA